MANNVYIGMRYVPKFVGNWDTTMQTVYEPLSIVMYNNSTYTSKKEVPTGTNITDTDYWVLTGNYNGQISNLQNQIDDMKDGTVPGSLQDQINDIVNTDLPALDAKIDTRELKQSERNYVLVFDSYGALGVSSKVEEACTGGYHTLNVGGAAFVGAGGGSTWVQALQTYLASLTSAQLAEITDIVFMGGINDYGYTAADIESAMAACDVMIKSYNNKARVSVIPISWSTRADTTLTAYVQRTLPTYSKMCNSLGWVFVPHMMGAIHKLEYMSSDGIHPTSAGVTSLGNALKTYFLTEKPIDHSTSPITATFTPETGINSSSVIDTKITGNSVNIMGRIVFTSVPDITIPTGFYGIKIGELSNSYIEGVVIDNNASVSISTSAYIHNKTTGLWELRPVTFYIASHTVFVTVEGGNITTDALQSLLFSFTQDLELS